MSERRFEFTDAKSHKFWSIRLVGNTHTVQFGRIGTGDQSQTKEFSTEAEAQRSYEKLIDEKLRKGYVEVMGEKGPSSAPPSPSPAPPTQTTSAATMATRSAAAVEEPKKPESDAAPERRVFCSRAAVRARANRWMGPGV